MNQSFLIYAARVRLAEFFDRIAKKLMGIQGHSAACAMNGDAKECPCQYAESITIFAL